MSGENAVLVQLSEKATSEFKNLLENKHLYQNVKVDANEILKQQMEQLSDSDKKALLQRWYNQELLKQPFGLSYQQVSVVPRGAARPSSGLFIILTNVSLLCRHCGRKEAFAPIWYRDVSNELRIDSTKHITLPDGFQLFFLVYQCQRCLGVPEGFLIRRNNWTFGLHGRSPIELVDVPNYIPERESHFYRDAVIAFNSGKILAALFYLRTFIEQFARRVTRLTGRITGDEIFDEYYKLLPTEHKDRMPSLREWYDKLSESLHAANPDAAVFEAAKAEIEKHFDIRRIYQIQEDVAKPAGAAADTSKAGG